MALGVVMVLDHVELSRLQFAFTTMFHILWPVLTVGLSIFLVVLEALWLRGRDAVWYRHARFWGRLLLLTFAVGVATGLVLEFQFGTNWALFATLAGGIFGNMIGFEAAMAFALEAAFLALMMFGWRRLPRPVHLASSVLVAFAASLSAFWIMDANSWMQTPTGVVMQGGRLTVTSYLAAIANPVMLVSFFHMWLACLEISLFVVAGISAWYIRREQHVDFFLRSFRMGVVAAIFITPLQIYVGDGSGRAVVRWQPAKTAAMEAHWQTNRPGEPASWALLAIPDPAAQQNSWEVRIPYLLSLLATRTETGQVRGLRSFPRDEQPPVALPFYAFRLMAGLGTALFLLMIWTLGVWGRGGLAPSRAPGRKWLLRGWMAGIPASYLAMETGWLVREVGRQPWIIYGLARTRDTGSILPPGPVLASLLTYVAAYGLLLVLFLLYVRKILHEGPDLESEPPSPGPSQQMPGKRPLEGREG